MGDDREKERESEVETQTPTTSASYSSVGSKDIDLLPDPAASSYPKESVEEMENHNHATQLPPPANRQTSFSTPLATPTASQSQIQIATPQRPPNGLLGDNLSRAPTQKPSTASLPVLKRKHTKLANKKSQPMQHLGITLGLPMILLFDLIIPCIIYYTWYHKHLSRWQEECAPHRAKGEPCPEEKPEFNENILGYAIVCFGFGELWILLARVYRLVRQRDQCAPLLSRSKWELDATSWVYGVAMILALIPFVVGSSLTMPVLYLYSPAFIMGFLGVLMLVTTVYPFKLPIGINSQPRGTHLRPFIYYAAEDFIAVDGLQDREFRSRYNERYESSKPFRRMFVWLTLWWMLGVCVYIGSLSAIIFTLPFHIAFGLSLGVLFSYISLWAAGSYAFVLWDMKRQDRLFEQGLEKC